MSNQYRNNEEEIEIASLFTILGNGIKQFFRFIGNIFIGFFDFLIQILLFLKKHFFKIATAAFIGGVIGLVLEFNKEQSYAADMLVQPNFESTRQLYNDIEYYNDLVKQKDSILLSKIFHISNSEAASFKKFNINPIENENDIINAYDEFILEADTLTVRNYSFTQFKRAFTDFDYKIHEIYVEATNKNIFRNLSNVILKRVYENQYFKKVKNLTNKNLNRTDSLLRKGLSETDSLLTVYKNVLLEKAKKDNASMSIDLGQGKTTFTKELDLFEIKKDLNEDLIKVIENISRQSEVINVISTFQTIGYEVKGIGRNLAFQLAFLGASFVLIFLLLFKLNRYLVNYKK